MNEYHVIVKTNGKWGIKKAGSDRCTRIYEKRRDALNNARTIIKDQGGVVCVHDANGRIVEKNSYVGVEVIGQKGDKSRYKKRIIPLKDVSIRTRSGALQIYVNVEKGCLK